MQNCNSTLLEVYVTHPKGQSLGNPAAQAKQKPDKQPITEATGNSLHHFYFRRFQIGFHLGIYLPFSIRVRL
ncbi:unnamed protein product [marine sediment metagenome]|uniref:Uncharacterized protein n=1 Tax=marine sediment metagenome TaxID=412755 RepID=X1QYG0_9ZZZZ